MEVFCRKLPKIELHAHLNGSCSTNTINKLLEKSGRTEIVPQEVNSLASCFEIFKLLHELCSSNEAIYMITKDVIEDFANENVKYLELRTTPKTNTSMGMTKRSYVESVLSAIMDSEACAAGSIIVRVIISIDRGRSLEDAWENLELAKFYRDSYIENSGHNINGPLIVGIDLSGNPETKDVIDFIPVLKAAKEDHFKLTIHLAEIPNRIEEIEAFLSVLPDRIGHATFLLPKYEGCNKFIEQVNKHKIPIEICLTSNVMGGTVPSLEEHHIEFWIERAQPISICTDDKGVFSTSLTKEFLLASNTFKLTEKELWKLSYDSINYIFADDSIKTSLREHWNIIKSDVLAY